MGEPTAREKKKIAKRIQAVANWKKGTNGATLPDWVDLDSLAPGTADVGTGVPDQAHTTYFKTQRDAWVSRRRKRAIGDWEHTNKEKRKQILLSVKQRTRGLVGMYLKPGLSVRCTYDGIVQGYFPSYAEAAAVYDRLAVQYEGDEAILNDPAAVAREDRVLARMKAEKEAPDKAERRMA